MAAAMGRGPSSLPPPLSHYEALGVSRDAPLEAIRRHYLRAALLLHPDKRVSPSSSLSPIDLHTPVCSATSPCCESRGGGNSLSEGLRCGTANGIPEEGEELRGSATCQQESASAEGHFLQVQEAWAVLRDPASRALYDRQLAALESQACSTANIPVWDEISLLEMEREEESGTFIYVCRCSDCFEVTKEDVQEALIFGGSDGSLGQKHAGSMARQCASAVISPTIIVPCNSCSLHIRVSISLDGD